MTTLAYYTAVINSLAGGLAWFFGLLLAARAVIWSVRILNRSLSQRG